MNTNEIVIDYEEALKQRELERKAELEKLLAWMEHPALRAFANADIETTLKMRLHLQMSACCHLRCVRDLKRLIETGKLPLDSLRDGVDLYYSSPESRQEIEDFIVSNGIERETVENLMALSRVWEHRGNGLAEDSEIVGNQVLNELFQTEAAGYFNSSRLIRDFFRADLERPCYLDLKILKDRLDAQQPGRL